MYECLFGQTPFAAEDRQTTKVKILKHRDTLMYPEYDHAKISDDAIDLIGRLLVEKEQRLCSRKYQLTDYIVSKFGGQIRVHWADKGHRNYRGMFVYPEDAEDIKGNPFFDGIPWAIMHRVDPPFRPRIQDGQDTKYFEVDGILSDDDGFTSDEEKSDPLPSHLVGPGTPSRTASMTQGHVHEEQQIVPSLPERLVADETACPTVTPPHHDDLDHRPTLPLEQCSHAQGLHSRLPTPCVGILAHPAASGITTLPLTGTASPRQEGPAVCHGANPVKHPRLDGAVPMLPPRQQAKGGQDSGYVEASKPLSKRRLKERRRPRDMILRDRRVGKIALDMRRQNAFIGYEYQRAKNISDIVDEEIAMAREMDPASLMVDMETSKHGCEPSFLVKHEGKLTRVLGLTRKNSKRPLEANSIVNH